mgnify:FL=1
MSTIYFWQQMITPHIASLALRLSKNGHNIVYVAETSLSTQRVELGWEIPEMGKINVYYAKNYQTAKSILFSAPADSIHICQGIRNNGIITYVQKLLRKNKLRQWVIMETINDSGFFGLIKRALYRFLILLYRKDIEIILAIGWKTPGWLVRHGFDAEKIFPFTYFLSQSSELSFNTKDISKPFRFIFVGGLVPGKKLNLLILALSKIKDHSFELVIIGDGPCKKSWQQYANKLIPNCSYWKGIIKMSDVPKNLSDANCLVLPSIHDGWGAVVSESMIVGTPAICSDACGVAEVVKASGFGGVFKSTNVNDLLYQLKSVIKAGPLNIKDQTKLYEWSNKITSDAGAKYLINIINFTNGSNNQPIPPWNEK